jgi:hypothetical protein
VIVAEIIAVGVFTPLLFAGLPVLAYDRYDRGPVVAGILASAWSGGGVLGAVGAFRAAAGSSPMRLAAFAAPWVAPERLRGHVMTAAATAEWVVQPLGYAVTGPVLGTLGLGGTYAFCAAGLSVAMLTLTIVLRQATGSVAPTANAADGGGVSRS